MLDSRRFTAWCGTGVLVLFAACSADAKSEGDAPERARASKNAKSAEVRPADFGTSEPDNAGSSGGVAGAAASTPPGTRATPPSAACDESLSYKVPGCPCKPGEKSACWTGPIEKRNTGVCQDGEQVCNDDIEFPLWGPCEGEVLECGDVPPDECRCTPGAVALCDEDCSVNILCIPWSTKTCLPNGQWTPCREGAMPTDPAEVQAAHAFLNAGVSAAVAKASMASGQPIFTVINTYPGPIPCGNVYHGCGAGFPPETWVGECAQHFSCGHAPGQ